MAQPLWMFWQFFKHESTIWCRLHSWEFIPKIYKLIFILFIIAKIWKQPFNRWVVKETVVYIHHGIILSNNKEWTIGMCNNLERISRNLCWMKNDNPNSLHMVWLHFYNIVEMTRFFRNAEHINSSQELGSGWGGERDGGVNW